MRSESRQFWLPKEIFDQVKIIQSEYQDERAAHTVRRLIRAALAHRAEQEKESGVDRE